MKRLLLYLIIIFVAIGSQAQNKDDWEPKGNWPFIYQKFRPATIYIGTFKKSKTQVPCNIHVEKQTIWYNQNDTLMEAVMGSIVRVEFQNGDSYLPVTEGLARIVKEDTIKGHIARLLCVHKLNRKALDQKGIDDMNKTQNMLQSSSSGFLSSFLANVAD